MSIFKRNKRLAAHMWSLESVCLQYDNYIQVQVRGGPHPHRHQETEALAPLARKIRSHMHVQALQHPHRCQTHPHHLPHAVATALMRADPGSVSLRKSQDRSSPPRGVALGPSPRADRHTQVHICNPLRERNDAPKPSGVDVSDDAAVATGFVHVSFPEHLYALRYQSPITTPALASPGLISAPINLRIIQDILGEICMQRRLYERMTPPSGDWLHDTSSRGYAVESVIPVWWLINRELGSFETEVTYNHPNILKCQMEDWDVFKRCEIKERSRTTMNCVHRISEAKQTRITIFTCAKNNGKALPDKWCEMDQCIMDGISCLGVVQQGDSQVINIHPAMESNSDRMSKGLWIQASQWQFCKGTFPGSGGSVDMI
ncbi:hypothetical protein K438DRAFT_1773912 [Mycena galopus ATCC 62051]|nr:hypothetical protein K438DRAFT_1773912 [Mycena galopus ATCC 62051]